MALATRCPECGASFRVVADQLKLRGGLVRCGDCRTVFDAIGTLSYLREEETAPGDPAASARTGDAPARLSADSPPPASEDTRSSPPTLMFRESPIETTPSEQAGTARDGMPDAHTDAAAAPDPAAARDAVPAERAETGAPAEERTAGAPGALPGAEPAPTPQFLLEPGEARSRRWLWRGGAALLVTGLLGQAVVAWHAELLARWPRLHPLALAVCDRLACTPHWPMRAEQIAVVGSELQAVPNTDLLELSAVLRNRSGHRLQQPALELTLTDTRNRIILRRVFRPDDYASAADRADGALPPGEDTAVRIHFEASGIAPVGFVLYPFYL